MLCGPRVSLADDGHASHAAPSSCAELRLESRQPGHQCSFRCLHPQTGNCLHGLRRLLGRSLLDSPQPDPASFIISLQKPRTSQAPTPSPSSSFSDCPTCTLCTMGSDFTQLTAFSPHDTYYGSHAPPNGYRVPASLCLSLLPHLSPSPAIASAAASTGFDQIST